MTRLRIGALLVVAAAAFTASAAGASGRGPVFISAVDSSGFPLIRATVIAPRGSRTVRLSENGKPAVGLTAINLGKSKAIVLAVDRSESMRGRPLANAIAAAKQFVSSTGATDHVGVVVFGRSAISLTHGEAGPGDAQSALSDVTVDTRSGTALYDAIVSAAGELQADSRPGRAIVVITDGKDVSSLASVDAAIRAAQGARASVYTIGIGGPSFTPTLLRRIASETGGTYR
ncbi:MAG: vWA domain-containing protein, partial [Gaiellaceae bacterium]